MNIFFKEQIILFTGTGVECLFQCLKNIEGVDIYECPENNLTKKEVFTLVERITKDTLHVSGKQVFVKTYSVDVIEAFCTLTLNNNIPISLYRMEWSIVPGEKIIITGYEKERMQKLINMGRDLR